LTCTLFSRFWPVCTPHMHYYYYYYYDYIKCIIQEIIAISIIHVCIWNGGKVGGSRPDRKPWLGGGGLPCVRRSVAVPPGNGVRVDVPCSDVDPLCVSDGGSRVWIARGGTTVSRFRALGVHRGHGDGRRQKRTPCGTPAIGRNNAFIAERL